MKVRRKDKSFVIELSVKEAAKLWNLIEYEDGDIMGDDSHYGFVLDRMFMSIGDKLTNREIVKARWDG